MRRLVVAAVVMLGVLSAIGTASPAVAAAPPTLHEGDSGSDVQAVQRRLKDLAYDPGPIDGTFTRDTAFAVVTFQKVQGLPPSATVTPEVRAALDKPAAPRLLAERLGGDRVEVDIGRQLMTIYRSNRPVVITHISSGNNERYCNDGRCSYAVTPRGDFRITRMARGWVSAPLGQLYNPAYFTSAGHAIHGSKSVPLHPASHGCVRIPMHTAEWFQKVLSRGMPVHVGG